jgi:hypothetical protein
MCPGLLVDGADGKPTNIAYGGAFLYDLFQPAAREYRLRMNIYGIYTILKRIS